MIIHGIVQQSEPGKNIVRQDGQGILVAVYNLQQRCFHRTQLLFQYFVEKILFIFKVVVKDALSFMYVPGNFVHGGFMKTIPGEIFGGGIYDLAPDFNLGHGI